MFLVGNILTLQFYLIKKNREQSTMSKVLQPHLLLIMDDFLLGTGNAFLHYDVILAVPGQSPLFCDGGPGRANARRDQLRSSFGSVLAQLWLLPAFVHRLHFCPAFLATLRSKKTSKTGQKGSRQTQSACVSAS